MLIGACNISAQTSPNGQMDERFNDGALPYGWFTQGWEVKDNVAQKKSMSFNFDTSGMTNNTGEQTGQTENTDQAGSQTSEGTGDGTDQQGSGQQGSTEMPDLTSLLGGGASYNFLMTPPLNVQDGETLSFSAKKGGADALSSFISSDDTDSTFVVERAKYGDIKWVKVADLTTELDTLYKTFTISNTEAGEYRFRFRAGGNVQIDSVAGFHIDSNAPDIYPIYQKKNIQPIDLGVCTQDTTVTISIINTGTGNLSLDLNLDGASAYSLDNSSLSIAAADTADVQLTFHYGDSRQGRNSTMLILEASDERLNKIPLPIDAVTSQPGVWADDFNQNELGEGWFTEGWEAKDGVATVKKASGSGGIASLLGGSTTTYYLMTPPLTVSDPNDVLFFSIKKAGGSGSGLGSLLGGSSSSPFYIEKTVYGSGKWEMAKDFTEAIDTTFTTQWLSGLEPGEYRFRFMASDSIVIDSVAGFQIDMHAPDLYVTLDSAVVRRLDYGMLTADSTRTFTVINTGTGTLNVDTHSSDDTRLTANNSSLHIAAGDSVLVDATMLRDDEREGLVSETLSFIPSNEQLNGFTVAFSAYIIKKDAWKEDFEPLYVIEDQTFPRRFPEGWTSTGWKLSQGGGNDIMSLFGGGNDEEQSWVATTDSKEYELVTPRLQAKRGHLMRFTADFGLDLMSLIGMGSAGNGSYLNVYYKRDADEDWTLYDTYTKSDTILFKAPYSGYYHLKFQGSGVTLDDFYGFCLPKDSLIFHDIRSYQEHGVVSELENVDGQIWNVSYDRTIKAPYMGEGGSRIADTVCLPYDFDIDDYYEPGTADLYTLAYVDTVYCQFIFQELPDRKMEAGKGYMVIVNKGELNFSAIGVKMTSKLAEPTPVYDFKEWYYNWNKSQVGTWNGSYDIYNANSRAFGLDDYGMWSLVNSGSWVNTMRAFFMADESYAENYMGSYRQNPEAGDLRNPTYGSSAKQMATRFYQQGDDDNGEIAEMANVHYLANICGNGTTGIAPTIHTINQDGTHDYFDMQGRHLNGKPDKGIYIQNGKKYIAR